MRMQRSPNKRPLFIFEWHISDINFVICGINLSPIIKGMKMFYLIKENSLNESRKEYVKGGLGIDYSDPNVTMRHITNKIEEALAFNSEDEANQYLCRGYVVIEQK